jgi:hypothetical protein
MSKKLFLFTLFHRQVILVLHIINKNEILRHLYEEYRNIKVTQENTMIIF